MGAAGGVRAAAGEPPDAAPEPERGGGVRGAAARGVGVAGGEGDADPHAGSSAGEALPLRSLAGDRLTPTLRSKACSCSWSSSLRLEGRGDLRDRS